MYLISCVTIGRAVIAGCPRGALLAVSSFLRERDVSGPPDRLLVLFLLLFAKASSSGTQRRSAYSINAIFQRRDDSAMQVRKSKRGRHLRARSRVGRNCARKPILIGHPLEARLARKTRQAVVTA